MATTCTLFRHRLQQVMLLTLGGAFMPLGGCATGSSASFTQAPLLFAEQTDPSGTATDVEGANPVTLGAGAQDATATVRVGSIGSGGGASIPTAAVTSVTRPLGDTVAQLASVLPVSVNVAPGSAVVAVGAPASLASLQATLSSGAVAVAVQTGILPPINVQADLAGAVGATAGTVTQLATNAPVVSTVLQFPPVAGLGNAVGGTLSAFGSKAVALLQPATATASPIASIASKPPIMPAATAVGVAQSISVTATSLLTATSANLAKICVLKGCR